MFTKKSSLLILTSILTIGVAVAGSVDYCEADFQKLLKGDKNLTNARLERVDLKGKEFIGVDFSNADLEEADLSNTNFTDCSFRNADLESVNFKGANLTNADLSYADLDETNLKGAIIKGAKFKQTELEYATWTDGRLCAEGSIGGCW